MARQQAIDLADQVFTVGRNREILHLYSEDEQLNGRTLTVKQKQLVNFGSCSYLGLEKDERLIEACVDAARRYGTQFSSSRTYMSTNQYQELESLFYQLYGQPCLVSPTTSLGHISTFPTLVKPGDLIVLDHQVHASIQTACKILKAQGERIEMIRHNDLNHLEKLIKQHRQTRGKIWYCVDGVYSMYGDLAPIDELYQLMDRYPEFYLYADDAHGMSWCGQNGKGSVRGSREHHPQMVLAVSLNKAFGCAGGLLVFPNQEMRRRVRSCGGGLVFSGPIQPPLLGAAIASANIHLSGEIEVLQQKLEERIKYCLMLIEQYNLPDVAFSGSPIFYIGTSELNAGINLVKRLHNDGFYVNTGLFPTVPLTNTGVRFTLTNHVTFEDIENLISAIAKHYPLALEEENVTSVTVANAFKLRSPQKENFLKSYPNILKPNFKVKISYSIKELEKEWDSISTFKGSTGTTNLRLLEEVFGVSKQQDVDHNHWLFRYITIRDQNNTIVLMAFFTICDIKTDMFSRPELSDLASIKRLENPDAFTSRCLMLGSPVTEGMHMYIDERHIQRSEVLSLFLNQAKNMQLNLKAEVLSLRDFPPDHWVSEHIASKGFLVEQLPETHYLEQAKNFATEEFIFNLKRDYRKHWKKNIIPFISKYSCHKRESIDRDTLNNFFNMYLNQQKKAKEISTFALPIELLWNSTNNGYWTCLELKHNTSSAACMFVMVDQGELFCMLLGTNPEFKKLGVYRACLYYAGKYARDLGLAKIHFGLTASLEKKRMGAISQPLVAFVRTTNNYQIETLESLSKGRNFSL
ncbi:aminotransferase class I/II-fold pyridoxal phosphate-dependent enzyme [Gynuella sunshinyii]|uniref:7-keto-8-aminopelargonate synthetase-related enzyme n=1 Tax=Gynuella sunshinyii YC6258 TaxID=1445510 RepID=A0A0C5VQV8_9GAMM|nr:aminotransferase class I/II-fold pyridoxal phosphate-dependent enzyme [Gynuella sunshinyii]AJQ96641.1 7-keto-8-aminopelargonate synthetase-related enzyme [Gynuella sunshinyii YC6258]